MSCTSCVCRHVREDDQREDDGVEGGEVLRHRGRVDMLEVEDEACRLALAEELGRCCGCVDRGPDRWTAERAARKL